MDALIHPSENEQQSSDHFKVLSTNLEDPKEDVGSSRRYYPLTDTMRLYAGWLLAWYCLVYAFGSYQHTRELPFRIPFVEALLPPFSPIVLHFTLAAFLFLLLTGIHRWLGRGRSSALILLLLGVLLFVLFIINV